MNKETLVGGWFDEHCCDSSEYRLRIDIETHREKATLIASVSGLLLGEWADLYFP
jgi:hypothetical protein